jgi:hypothetical protein
MKKLEIGDRIYERGDAGFYSWTTVVRTTPTLAITKGGGKFKINVVIHCHTLTIRLSYV